MMCLLRVVLVLLTVPALVWGQAQVVNGNRVHAGWTNYGTTAGTATAYTLTFSPALPGYIQGQCFLFKPHIANTGAATLNVQGKGALSLIKLSGGSLVPLVAGDLVANRLVQVCHDGTTLQLMGTAPDASSPGGGITTMPTAADQVLVSNSTTTGTWQSLPNCPDSGGNHLNYNIATNQWLCGTSGGTVGSVAFSALTGGTNTAAAMLVGTGASLAPTGTGTITATGLSTPLPVTSGGTGAAPSTSDQVFVSDSPTAGTWKPLPDCPDTAGQHLNYTAATNTWGCGSSGGGSGHTIQDEGTPRTARPTLNFLGGGVSCVDNAGALATECTIAGGGGGDASTTSSTSVDNELALFSGTGGKTLKRATTTGLLKGTAGVLSAAVAGTDYVVPGGTVATATALTADPVACLTAPQRVVVDFAANGTLVCQQLAFTDLTGSVTDAQIPDLNTLSTGLTVSRCVETDGTGKLGVAAGACGVSGSSTGISGATNHGLMVATGGTTGTSLGIATNGQLPIGSTGADPVLAVPQGTANQIRVTPGPGSITFDFPPAGVTLPGTTSGNIASATGLPIVGGTTGTLSAARGGTDVTTPTDDTVLIGNGTVWQLKALPNCVAANETLQYTAATNLVSCGTVTAGSSAFSALTGGTNTTAAMVVGTGASLAPLGTGTITATALAADPPPCGANLFATDIATNGILTCTQPTFGNLGGTAATTQLPTAVADGINKGILTLAPSDFNCTDGVCSLDYANAQEASGTAKGFLTSGDWTTFNAKQPALGFTAENVANRDPSAALGTSNTVYPTQGAVFEFVRNTPKVLTNTGVTPRPCVGNNTATILLNVDNATGCDYIQVAELSQTATFDLQTAPTPTYVNGQFFTLRIFTTTQRALVFTTGAGKFASEGIPLPTFTRANGYVLYGFSYNPLTNRWVLAATNQETNYGTDGFVRTAKGPGVEPVWQAPAPGGGLAGTIGTIHLPMSAARFPANNFAVFDGSESNGRLLFDGGAVSECAYWGPFRMNSDYTSTPVLKFQYSMTSSNTGGVAIAVSVLTSPMSSGIDIQPRLFTATTTCTQTPVPATIGDVKEISCTLTSTDGMAANRLTKIQLCRATGDVVDDNTTSDMEGLTAVLEYTR